MIQKTGFIHPNFSKKNLDGFIKIIVLVLILVVLGTGASLYFRIWDPIWNPFRPEPEEVFEKMFVNMGEIKTVHSEAKIDIEIKGDPQKSFSVSLDFCGDSDKTNPKIPKSTTDFSVVAASEGMQFTLAGENKTIGETSYVKLTTVPALPMLEPYLKMMGVDVSKIKNQWIKVDSESYKNLTKEMTGKQWTQEMEEEFEKSAEKQKEIQKKSKKLLKLFEGKKLYLIKEELPDEKINQNKVYHYILSFNKEGIKESVPEILSFFKEMAVELNGTINEQEYKEAEKDFLKGIDEFFEKTGEITFQAWIGKKANLLYKIKGEKEIDLSKFEAREKGKIIIKIDADFSNFGQPIEIAPPKKFKRLEEIFSKQEKLFQPLSPKYQPLSPRY